MSKKRPVVASTTPTLRGEVILGLVLLMILGSLYFTRGWWQPRLNSAPPSVGVPAESFNDTLNPALNQPGISTISIRKNLGSPAQINGEAEGFELDVDQMSLAIQGTLDNEPFTATFDEFSGMILVKEGQLLGGSLTLLTPSLRTGTPAIDVRLQGQAGLDTVTYPTLDFDVISLEEKNDQPLLTGLLRIKGTQHDLSLPLTKQGTAYTATFTLNPTTLLLTDPALGPELTVTATFAWR